MGLFRPLQGGTTTPWSFLTGAGMHNQVEYGAGGINTTRHPKMVFVLKVLAGRHKRGADTEQWSTERVGEHSIWSL
jgi:hypothetical protein